MIYDYLFFKSHQLGKWSKNFEDTPVLAGVIWVGACFMFNVLTISILLDALGYFDYAFDRRYKFFYAICLVSFLVCYYRYNGRYKKIIDKYEERERSVGKGLHPVIVIIIYYVVSFLLLFLAGLYRNKMWIFG